MTKKWHKGPPPSVGWWPASTHRNSGVYRWWDGKQWSYHANAHDSAERAAYRACMKVHHTTGDAMRWTARPTSWPERSKT